MTDEEVEIIIAKDPSLGPLTWIPKKERYYTVDDSLDDLNAMRAYKGSTKAIEQIFGAVDDNAARKLSEDENATVEWFNETLPEADDITNLMMAEAVCASAINSWENELKERNLI